MTVFDLELEPDPGPYLIWSRACLLDHARALPVSVVLALVFVLYVGRARGQGPGLARDRMIKLQPGSQDRFWSGLAIGNDDACTSPNAPSFVVTVLPRLTALLVQRFLSAPQSFRCSTPKM